VATSKSASASPAGTSSEESAAPHTRRIVVGLVVGLVLSLMSLFTPIPWAVKVALVATAVLGIAGYSVVHVVHLYDPVDEGVVDDASSSDGAPSSDDKDASQ
jgi:hypothetical protein